MQGVARGCVALLERQELEFNLARARSGDDKAREELLRAYKPHVLRIAEKSCGRGLEWGRDDELSIGLIALNEAVDRFDMDRSDSFPAFAGLVIKSRLKDFYRREKKLIPPELSLQDREEEVTPAELNRAWELYRQEKEARERALEITEYRKLLADYEITFDELVSIAPKRKQHRQELIGAAREMARRFDLMAYLFRNKRLPLNELGAGCGLGRKTLERGRKYIISVALVLYYRERFLYLSSYLRLDGSGPEGVR